MCEEWREGQMCKFVRRPYMEAEGLESTHLPYLHLLANLSSDEIISGEV